MDAFLVSGSPLLAHAALEGNSKVGSVSAFCHACETALLTL